MITPEQINAAAFWDQDICVKCGFHEASDEDEEEHTVAALCPNCRNTGLFSGHFLATLLSNIDTTE